MQFVSASENLVLFTQFAWQFSTGTPTKLTVQCSSISGSVCIVYLTLNRSIRKSVLTMICSMLPPKVKISVAPMADGILF